MFEGISENAELEKQVTKDEPGTSPSSAGRGNQNSLNDPKELLIMKKSKAFNIKKKDKDFTRNWRKANKAKKQLLKKFNK